MAARNDRQAILHGYKGAIRLQRRLGLDVQARRSQRVDVFDSITQMGAVLMFQPLEPLLGAFVREGEAAGIILSTRRPLGMQRFTAAHELGHLVLGHDPHADDAGILRRGPFPNPKSFPQVPSEEREADAFASYFLLPSYLIKEQMVIQNWGPSDFEQPEIVYQASLRFGCSYRAAIFALQRDKVINGRTSRRLRETQPHELKRLLLGEHKEANLQGIDVWHLTEKDEGATIEAGRDDLFLLRLAEDSGAGYIWTFEELCDDGFVILTDGREPVGENQIGSPSVRRTLVQASTPLAGTYHIKELRPWDPDDAPHTLTLHCKTALTDEAGLFEPQRTALLAPP